MADHSKPTQTSTYANFVTELNNRLNDLAFMLDPTKTTVTNRPVGSVRWSSTTRRFESWSGTAWVELVVKNSNTYDIRTALADDVTVMPNGLSAKAYGQIGRAVDGTSGNDANYMLESGVWFFASANAPANVPTSGMSGFLHVYVRTSGTSVTQVWYSGTTSAPRVYMRRSTNSGATWGVWKHITADADWNAVSGADGFIANKPTLGTAAAANLQTAQYDATAGALLSVGAFGMGGSAALVSLTAVNALDNISVTSIYRVPSVNDVATVNGPTGGTSGIVYTMISTTNAAAQFYINLSNNRVFYRRKSTTWFSWQEIYTSLSVLGTVSQASGVPTGSVIERGSNANGEYVRFADGTQICTTPANVQDGLAATTADGPLWRSTGYTWTFPATFSTTDGLVASASSQVDGGRFFNARIATGSTAIITRFSTTSDSTTTRTFRAMAIGRWF